MMSYQLNLSQASHYLLCLQTKFRKQCFYINHQTRALNHHDLNCAMMSKLLIIIAFSASLFLDLTTLPADAGASGSLTSAGGHECDLKETKVGSGGTERRLRLTCVCNDASNNNVVYQCFYRSDTSTCCKKSSVNHYHSYVPAYYAQLADQIKGKKLIETKHISQY